MLLLYKNRDFIFYQFYYTDIRECDLVNTVATFDIKFMFYLNKSLCFQILFIANILPFYTKRINLQIFNHEVEKTINKTEALSAV